MTKLLLIVGGLLYLGPIFGLVGTVIGMIKTFQEITVFGSGDAQELSEGISLALVTTELGLLTVVPGAGILILAHILKFRKIQTNKDQDSDREFAVSAVLNLFVGFLGAHRFYARKTGSGIFYLLTIGGLIIGQYIDFILLCSGRFYDAEERLIRYKPANK